MKYGAAELFRLSEKLVEADVLDTASPLSSCLTQRADLRIPSQVHLVLNRQNQGISQILNNAVPSSYHLGLWESTRISLAFLPWELPIFWFWRITGEFCLLFLIPGLLYAIQKIGSLLMELNFALCEMIWKQMYLYLHLITSAKL